MNLNFIYLGGEFNYPYSLAIESAARTQKVDHIYLWHTGEPTGKYYEAIKHRVILKPVEVPKFTSVERTKNEWTKRAHLKDYLAYKILYEEGGIVADLDTLFLKDITDLLGDYDFVVAMDCEKESQEVYPCNSSMFIGRKGSPITKDLMHITKHILNQPWEIQWGSTGPVLVTTVVREHRERVLVTEHGVLGGFGGHEAKILYDDDGILKENCKVVHLFAHAWKEKFAGITPEYVETSKSLYARLARQVCGTSQHNILFICLDSCRYDTFMAADKPNMDNIGKATKVHSFSCFTVPSIIGHLQGFPPIGVGHQLFPELGGNFPWIASVPKEFRRLGYSTAFLSPNPWMITMDKEFGFFSKYFDVFKCLQYNQGPEGIKQIATDVANIVTGDKPVFMYILLLDTHAPFPSAKKGTNNWEKQVETVEYVDSWIPEITRPFKDSGRDTRIIITADHAELVGPEHFGHDPRSKDCKFAPDLFEIPYIDTVIHQEAKVDIESWLKRGQHYRPLFDWLKTHECRNIMEIGTHNGNNAVMMIKAATSQVPIGEIHYYGFDLFEDLTEEAHDREFSYPKAGNVKDIAKKIAREAYGAEVKLIKGDTKETLQDTNVMDVLPDMDFIYIDGGHSIETIRSDWANVQKFVDSHTVIFLDDYFPDKDDLGCKFLLKEMKGYKVEVLPTIDTYQHKEPLRIQLVKATKGISDEEWLRHQEDERRFWAYDKNVSSGQVKEQAYVPFLGLDKLRKGPYFDLKGMSILDIGGGPVSLLLRCVNFSKGVVLDPCTFDDWILERYKKNDIEFIKHKAEDWEPPQMFDEAWIYNVLQHVQDPDKVVAMAKRAARKIRVFEWRETPITGGHPHTFTTEDFDRLFGKKGNARNVTKDDMLYDLIHNTEEKFYWGVFDYGKQVAIEPEGCDVGHPLGEAKGDAGHTGRFRFHLLGLAHLPVSERYMGCAFTQKIVKLSKMLLLLGHEVYLYGAEGSDAPCTEFIQTHTLEDIRDAWGEGDNRFEIGYDWKSKGFKHDFNIKKTPTTLKYYEKAITEINKRKRNDDFLLIMQGEYQRPIDNGVKLWLTVEPGIGYRGSYCRFRAFESAYLMNFTYGSEHPKQSINGSYYDRVIPNYFDPKDFPFVEKKEDYFFFIGRMISRKGVWTAVKATQAIGAKLILAGQQDSEIDVTKLPPHCEFIGYVEPDKRSELMGKARAVFVPTLYLEAFGGVNVEAQLCGTAVITTNFSVFDSTVVDGVTGYRCNTLDDFVWAANNVHRLNPYIIRSHAEQYLMDNVKWQYQRWFEDLYQLYLSAKDSNIKGWHHIRQSVSDWRKAIYERW